MGGGGALSINFRKAFPTMSHCLCEAALRVMCIPMPTIYLILHLLKAPHLFSVGSGYVLGMQWPVLIWATCTCVMQQCFGSSSHPIWVESAWFKKWKKLGLKKWVKLGYPRNIPIWPLPFCDTM